MLLQLSRLSFWLAAALAAIALFAPHGRETPLTLAAAVASLMAFFFWRSGLRRRPHVPVLPELPAGVVLDAAALRDAALHVARAAHQAVSFEAALHAVARVLRSELGARGSEVRWVLEVAGAHARVSGLIESQPGFRTAPQWVALDGSPLGAALATRRAAGAAPGPLVLPVATDDAMLATIELSGLDLPIEAQALQDLLEAARSSLAARAAAVRSADPPAFRPIDDPNIGDNVAEAEHAGSSSCPDGCAAAGTSGMLGDSVHEQGLDDLVVTPRRAQGRAAMLSRQPRPHRPADAGATPLPGTGGMPAPALDAEALARLRELDPQGRNKLIERVLTAFQTSVARLQPQFDAARASGDLQALRLVAHTLKSSSASIGALHLSKLCAQTEAAIRQDTGEDLGPGLDALSAAIAEALRAIDAQLASGARG